MSNYIIKVKNTSGTEGTVIADAGFSYADKLNEVNDGQLKISGTGEVKRSLFEIGSEIYIYRNGTMDFNFNETKLNQTIGSYVSNLTSSENAGIVYNKTTNLRNITMAATI